MQKIVPNLWCNGNAEELTRFYLSVFPESKIKSTFYYPRNAEEGLADFQADFAGKVLTIDFEIYGYQFTAINAGAEFKANPSISFFVTCDSKTLQDELWQKLSNGGTALMPLQAYPFSDYYGWVQDKFGFSWQLILDKDTGDPRPRVMPSFLFTGKNPQAEAAMQFYTSVFDNAQISSNLNYHQPGTDMEGMIAFADFTLAGEWFAAMDGGPVHPFSFNEAISLLVNCSDQAEIDTLWEKLSAVPESEICGWLKDKYGVSWQIAPQDWQLMFNPNGTVKAGAFKAMMKMGKLDIETLRTAGQ